MLNFFKKSISASILFSLNLLGIAHAALPSVEPPKSSTDGSLYGQISGYMNDGVVLGGLVLAAIAFLVVGIAIVSTFSEVRDGKATWGKFGGLVAVGVILVVTVIWLATQASTVIL